MANLIDILKKRLAWLTVQPAHEPNDSAFVASYLTAYHQQMIADLSEICEQPLDEAGAQKWLKDLLAQNWQKTNNSPLAYTATPDSTMTSLMCELAYDLALAEKNELCDIDVTIPRDTIPSKPVFELLMPDTEMESTIITIYPSLDETDLDIRQLLRTHIIGRQAKYLIPIRLLLTIEGETGESMHHLRHPYFPFGADIAAYEYTDEDEFNRLKGHSHDAEAFVDTYLHTKDEDSDDTLYHLLVRARERMTQGSVSGRYGGEVELSAAAEAIEGIAILEAGFDSFFKRKTVDADGQIQYELIDPVVINGRSYPGALPESLYELVDIMERQHRNHGYTTEIQVVDGKEVTVATRYVHHNDTDTCTNTYQGDLSRFITGHADELKQVKNPNLEGLRAEKIEQLNSSRQALVSAIEEKAKAEAIGVDKLVATREFLSTFELTVTFASLHELKQLLADLDVQAILNLFADPTVFTSFAAVVKTPFDWDNLFLSMQASKIKALVTVLPDHCLQPIFKDYYNEVGVRYVGGIENVHRLFQAGQDIESKKIAFCEAMAKRKPLPRSNLLVTTLLQHFDAGREEDVRLWSLIIANQTIDWSAPVGEGKTVLDVALEKNNPYITSELMDAFAEDLAEFKQVVEKAYDKGWVTVLQQADNCNKDWMAVLGLTDETLICEHHYSNEPFLVYLLSKVSNACIEALPANLIVESFDKNKFLVVKALLARDVSFPIDKLPKNWPHAANQFILGERYAIGQNYLEVVMSILKKESSSMKFSEIVEDIYKKGHMLLAARLVDEEIGLDVIVDNGKTVLMLAYEKGARTPLCVGLVERLSDESLLKTDSEGKTIFDYVTSSAREDVLVALLKKKTATGDFLFDLKSKAKECDLVSLIPVSAEMLDIFMELMAVPEVAERLERRNDGEDNEARRSNTMLESWLICAVREKRHDIVARLLGDPDLRLTSNLQVRDYTEAGWELSSGGYNSDHYDSELTCQGLLTVAISFADDALICTLLNTQPAPTVNLAEVVQLAHPDNLEKCPNAFKRAVALYGNIKDRGGQQLTHYFAKSGNLAALDRLLSFQVMTDIDAKDGQNKTPLYYAIKAKDTDMVRNMVDAGAKLDKQGCYYLHHAVACHASDIVDYIANAVGYLGADEQGNTVVEVALQQNPCDESQVLKLLGEVPIDQLAENGSVALLLAAKNNSLEVVDRLLEKVPLDGVLVEVTHKLASHINVAMNRHNLQDWFRKQERLEQLLATCLEKAESKYDEGLFDKLARSECCSKPLKVMLHHVPKEKINTVLYMKPRGRWSKEKPGRTQLTHFLQTDKSLMALLYLQHPDIDLAEDKKEVLTLVTSSFLPNVTLEWERVAALKSLVQHDKLKLTDNIPGSRQSLLKYLTENEMTDVLQEIAADKRRRRQYGRYSAARKTLRGYKPLAAEGGERAVLNPANEVNEANKDDNWPISQIVGSVSNQGEFDEEEEMEGPSNTISRA